MSMCKMKPRSVLGSIEPNRCRFDRKRRKRGRRTGRRGSRNPDLLGSMEPKRSGFDREGRRRGRRRGRKKERKKEGKKGIDGTQIYWVPWNPTDLGLTKREERGEEDGLRVGDVLVRQYPA
ncbi:hypothetical protein SLEP1_g59119 [Rubroshorea leprosula]|uniref:Uncharacterized protein n=1 Tax=Rubroshorea leprosula TaxID=152421 RepID=A0AAV5MUZ9_9ROSI|nr:hypothetical protein SLEP1_g59119 [Rubroshorea leprosula]